MVDHVEPGRVCILLPGSQFRQKPGYKTMREAMGKMRIDHDFEHSAGILRRLDDTPPVAPLY